MGNVMINVGNGQGGALPGGDTNFVGTTLIHKFTPDELAQWKAWDGQGYPEGRLDDDTNMLYV